MAGRCPIGSGRLREATQQLAWLDGGGQVNACHRSGNTVLMLAASNGREVVVDALLRQGAEVNLRNSDFRKSDFGSTALIRAAAVYTATAGHERVVELLLQHGADATVPRDTDVYTVVA